MPPKKTATKASEAGASSQPPESVLQRSQRIYASTRPHDAAREQKGLDGLTATERTNYVNGQFTAPGAAEHFSKKAQKELYRQINEAGLPLRQLPRKPHPRRWGRDKNGLDIANYRAADYDARRARESQLAALRVQSQAFRFRRSAAARGLQRGATGEPCTLEDGAATAERARRREMAALSKDLYGVTTSEYALDPEWDDVVPIPQSEPAGALASIAYPGEYAEAASYLRAVMAADERSPRCGKLTEDIIRMNPAHYTVWLYRFSIIKHLNISIMDELAWLNTVALENLKNYQIWHHRQLLVEHHFPAVADRPDEVRKLARSERRFMTQMLAEDTKNYHVWSYRQYLVRKLGMWDGDELRSVEDLIDDDVRNNSAWSHRFFLVFANPAQTTGGSHATERDPAVPAAVVDGEIAYATAKIALAPQNQSPWNYLRGVLVKGGRPLASVRAYVESYVADLGKPSEEVRSSHALDQLADIYKELGDKDRAALCLRRLAEKWDRIRAGYWEYRLQDLGS